MRMSNKLNKTIIIFLILIVINCFVIEIDGKRSFSVRIRSKNSGRSNSRRKPADTVHVPPAGKDGVAGAGKSKSHDTAHGKAQQKPDAPDTKVSSDLNNNKNPVGPPPAYPGLGNNPVPVHGPPAYSAGGYGNPPSYAASQHDYYRNQRESIPSGHSSYGSSYPYNSGSNIQSIPPRGQATNYGAGLNTGTTFQGLGTGHNSYGGPSQSAPYGLYNNQQTAGMGGYGSGYGYGSHQSSNGFSFGNVLTGVALWNVGRGFNHYPSPHQQHVHVHNHHNTDTTSSTTINSLLKTQPDSITTTTNKPIIPTSSTRK